MITTCIYYLPPALPFKSYIQSRISISILVHRKRKSPFSSCQQVTRGGNTWKSSILRVVLKEEDEEWWGKKRKERWMVITLFEGMYTAHWIHDGIIFIGLRRYWPKCNSFNGCDEAQKAKSDEQRGGMNNRSKSLLLLSASPADGCRQILLLVIEKNLPYHPLNPAFGEGWTDVDILKRTLPSINDKLLSKRVIAKSRASG